MVYNEQSHSIRIMVNERDYWLKCLFMDKDTRDKTWSNRIIVLWYSLVKWILCGWSTKCSFHTSTFYPAFVMLPVFPAHCNFKLLTINLYEKYYLCYRTISLLTTSGTLPVYDKLHQVPPFCILHLQIWIHTYSMDTACLKKTVFVFLVSITH